MKNRTPLTHQRFLNRHKGSYGPAIRAGEASFPFPGTPVDGLLVCGDSVFPGIGVPGKQVARCHGKLARRRNIVSPFLLFLIVRIAVAGSGILAANSVSFDSIGPQMKLLKKMRETAECV